MPCSNPAAPQLDHRPSGRNLRAARFWFATAARWSLGTFAIMPVFCPCQVMAASMGTTIKVSGVRDELVWPTLCGTAGIAVFLVLRTVARWVRAAIAGSTDREAGGDILATSAEQFVEDARRLHIDSKIARESFQLLSSLTPAGASIGVNDDLRATLKLSDHQIASLISALPELCDRSRQPANAASVLSVYDLLHHIESSPKSTSGQFYIRNGSAVAAMPASPVSPLADLKNASPRDSRFRTRAHFSGVKRRASDYCGPYRRATDRRPDENYAGPLRRASDRKDGVSTTSEPRTGDRRSSERRAVLSQETCEQARQHRAVSADTSLLNQCLKLPASQTGIVSERDRLVTREAILLPAEPLQHR